MPARHRSDQDFAQVGELGVVPLATLGSRLAARLADLLILFVPTYFVFVVILGGGVWGISLLLVLETAVYDAVLTANTGATPGKRLLRIRVVRVSTGAPVGWVKSFPRAVVLGALGWLIIAIFALSDERNHRGLHDLAAGTVVIAV
jgi:uncharacterized RDD family membrane protein YckC